jgi:peroxiredoxin
MNVTHVKNQLAFWIVPILALGLWACQTGGNGTPANEYQIEGEFAACSMDSIRLYRLNGFSTEAMASTAVQKEGGSASFSLSGQMPPMGLYLLGQAPNNLLPVLLGTEGNIKVSGNCNNLRKFGKVENSALNADFTALNQRFTAYNQRRNQLVQQLNVAIRSGNQAQQQAIGSQLDDLYFAQVQQIDSLRAVNEFLADAFAPNVLAAFNPLNNPQGYSNSVVHFAESFLQNVDFQKDIYNHFPVISDNLRVYTQTLFQQLDEAQAKQYLDRMLNRMPEGSRLYRNSLAAVIQTLDRLEKGSFISYADRYESTFELPPSEQTYLSSRRGVLEEKVRRAQALAIGVVPPEIELPTPEGKIVKLSDLRGKVVLIDFWASWCRPCRQENPNVVRVYNQYKDKGFEILGVSLDRTKDRWVQAIAQDGLDWYHVSDLQYWSSVAAQDYMVSGIPATFLLDREGKIIAKNLRGPALEAKLKEVLGS